MGPFAVMGVSWAPHSAPSAMARDEVPGALGASEVKACEAADASIRTWGLGGVGAGSAISTVVAAGGMAIGLERCHGILPRPTVRRRQPRQGLLSSLLAGGLV